MSVTTVPKSKFKPRAFAYLRRVEHGETVCITDHGRPVADIVPHGTHDDQILRELRGVIQTYIDPTRPLDVSWEAES